MLERQCAAKDCCWDSQRYQQRILMQQTGQSSNSLMCAWRVPDYSMYGMPSLAYSLRGCCDYSPCVERRGRDGSFLPGQPRQSPPPTMPTAQPPVNPPVNQWSAWGDWGACSKSCQAGIQQRNRVCTSGESQCVGRNFEEKTCFTNCDPITWSPWRSSGCSATCGGGYETLSRDCLAGPCTQSTEYRLNQRCNQDPCMGGWNPWRNMFG